MRTKFASMCLLIVTMLSLSISCNAADISPLWTDGNRCTPTISINGNTATCSLSIQAEESSAKISASMVLYRVASDGSLVRAASWTGLSGTGKLSTSKSYPYATSGTTYKLVVTGSIVSSSGTTTLNESRTAVCP